MSQFVHNDIIEHFHWCHHQSPIDVNITDRCASSPAFMLCAQMDGCWMDIKKRLIIGYTLLQFFAPLLPVPPDELFFKCLLDLILVPVIGDVCDESALIEGEAGLFNMFSVHFYTIL